MKHKTNTLLKVVARAPFHIFYEGTARVVSAENRVGKFDVLPGHANFFSVILPGDVQIETETDTISFPSNGGIIGVRDDAVMIFVNM